MYFSDLKNVKDKVALLFKEQGIRICRLLIIKSIPLFPKSMKEFRDRLKEDNSVYKAHLVAEAARIWHWRANLSEEKIKIKEKKQ